MNVSGQVYEEPLTFECGTHISRRGRSDISESHNDTLAIALQKPQQL